MVQLSENEVPRAIQHPQPTPMTQPVQLTGDTMTQHHHPAANRPDGQLATNGSHKKHDRPDSLGSWNCYPGDRTPQSHQMPQGKSGEVVRGSGEVSSARNSYRPHDYNQVQQHKSQQRKDSRGLYPPDQQRPSYRNRWSYYGDPRARADQMFLRDPDDRRDPRVNRRDPRDEPRDPRDDPRDPRDGRQRRSLGNDPQRQLERYRKDIDRSGEDDRDRERNKNRIHGANDNGREQEGSEAAGRQSHTSHEPGHDRHHGLARDYEHMGDGDQERDRVRDRNQERDRARDRDQERESMKDREQERGHTRSRDQERERERDRDLGRDRYHEPRRREPVGEETGYDSDHSRVSRSTAMSYRSLPRRPRADSVASHASLASHASSRPPLPPASRSARGKFFTLHVVQEPWSQHCLIIHIFLQMGNLCNFPPFNECWRFEFGNGILSSFCDLNFGSTIAGTLETIDCVVLFTFTPAVVYLGFILRYRRKVSLRLAYICWLK